MYNVFIPNVLLENHSVSSSAKIFFIYLYKNMQNNECNTSNKEFASLLKTTEKTISAWVKELVNAEIVKTELIITQSGTNRTITLNNEFVKKEKTLFPDLRNNKLYSPIFLKIDNLVNVFKFEKNIKIVLADLLFNAIQHKLTPKKMLDNNFIDDFIDDLILELANDIQKHNGYSISLNNAKPFLETLDFLEKKGLIFFNILNIDNQKIIAVYFSQDFVNELKGGAE